MPYVLIGKNGDEYGPVELEMLISWAREGRVSPQSEVRITPEGVVVRAFTIPELALENVPPKPAQAAAPPMAASYPRESVVQIAEKPSKYGLISISFWSILSVILIITTRDYGYIMAFLGVIDMFGAYRRKDPYLFQIVVIGGIAMIVAAASLFFR